MKGYFAGSNCSGKSCGLVRKSKVCFRLRGERAKNSTKCWNSPPTAAVRIWRIASLAAIFDDRHGYRSTIVRHAVFPHGSSTASMRKSVVMTCPHQKCQRQRPDPATARQCVTDKIHRPDLIRLAWQFQFLSLDGDTVALAPAANGQACLLIKPEDALVVRFHTFTTQQSMDTPVATCQFLTITACRRMTAQH